MRNKRIEGAKHFLSTMEVGHTIVYDGPYRWRSLASAACTLAEDFGVLYKFRTKYRKGYRTITRVK